MSKNYPKSVIASIESLNHDGRGVTHIDGKVTFIENALPHEKVEFIYQKKHHSYDEGKLSQLLIASPERTTPQCKHFGICGGCSLQHLDATTQIQYKQKILLDQLQHLGGVIPQKILPALRGDNWGYRHKARLGVKYVVKKNKVLIGFREKNSNFLSDLTSCAVLHPQVGEKFPAINQLIQSLESYQSIPQLEIAITHDVTAFILRHLQPLSANDLEKLIEFSKSHKIHIYLQPQGPDSVHLLWPQTDFLLTYELASYQLQFQFRPDDFTQINPSINEKMITQAIDLLQPQKDECILDLFCGIGNFTLPLAKYANKVVGVEGSASLVQRAKDNALRNDLRNVEIYVSNLAGEFKWGAWANQSYDKILLDPPRSGAAEIVSYIKNFRAKKILYVSCNPATLARDTKTLIDQDYTLTQAGVMDMFPHTNHIEAMALFEKT